MNNSTVVTGIGVATPTGLGIELFWAQSRAGVSGIRPVAHFDASRYPSQLAGVVPDFDPSEHLPSRLLPQTDHMTRLALVAADEAVADAGLPPSTGDGQYERGVITASSAGGFEFGQRELEQFFSQGPQFMGAYMSFAWFYAVNTGQISIRNGLKGPGGVLVTDQAGGLDAIAQARRQVRKGTPVILCGGVDGSICPWGWVAQLAGGRLSTSADPQAAYLPFDARADGHVAAEGGAILILEDRASAISRSAPQIYGEIAGYAASFDPAPGTGRATNLRRAIEDALIDAGVVAAEVDVVFADGAAVPDLDLAEAVAIADVFGPRAVPVTVPKTMLGRMYAGAGALDVASALLAIRDQVIPPTVGVRPQRRYPITLVTGEELPHQLRTAVVIARGDGGFNSAMVIRAVTDQTTPRDEKGVEHVAADRGAR